MDESFRFYVQTFPGFRSFMLKSSSPVTGLEWPLGFQELRFPDFMTTAQDGGKVVSLTHRPPLPPGNTPGTHFY